MNKLLIGNKYAGLLFLILGLIIIFYQFFFLGKIPIPADTLVGSYYPWLDYKWGYSVGVPVKNPPISDVFSQFFLWKYLSVDYFKNGQFPLWNPYSLSGTPFLATYHSAVLQPFNILLLLPGYLGWGFYIFAQFLAASLGMYLLMGRWVQSTTARLTSSLVFSFSGLMTTWAEFGTGVWAASQLPWIFYFIESYLSTRKNRFLILLSISFALLILSGHAQLTIYSSILFFIYLVYLLIVRKVNLSSLIPPVIFWLFGVGLTSIQLLPSYDFMQRSIRNAEEYSRQFNYGLSPVYELIRLSAADFFGNPATYNHWDKFIYHEYSSFLGTLTLPFIFPFFLRRFRNHISNFFIWTFVISLFLSIKNPVTEWIYSQPIPLLTYSSASRILFVTSFSAACLLGLGINKLSEPEYVRWLKRFALVNFSILLGVIIGLAGVVFYLKSQNVDNMLFNNFEVSIRNLVLPISLLIIFISLIFLKKKKVLLIALSLLFFFDMGRYFLKYNPFVSFDLIFPKTPLIKFLQNQEGIFRISRADSEIMPPNTWIAYKLSSVEGYDPLSLESYGRYFNRLNQNPYLSNVSRYIELKRVDNKFIDSLNTKYFLAIKRDEKRVIPGDLINDQLRKANYPIVFEDRNSVVVENPKAAGFAYFVSRVSQFNNKSDLLKVLDSSDFDPTEEALVIGDIPKKEFKKGEEINITGIKANHVNLETKTTNESFLVLAQSFDPGWKLKINGHFEKISSINMALQGIIVPAGYNHLELFYWPDSFELGLKFSLITAGLIFLASLYFKLKKIW